MCVCVNVKNKNIYESALTTWNVMLNSNSIGEKPQTVRNPVIIYHKSAFKKSQTY